MDSERMIADAEGGEECTTQLWAERNGHVGMYRCMIIERRFTRLSQIDKLIWNDNVAYAKSLISRTDC